MASSVSEVSIICSCSLFWKDFLLHFLCVSRQVWAWSHQPSDLQVPIWYKRAVRFLDA